MAETLEGLHEDLRPFLASVALPREVPFIQHPLVHMPVFGDDQVPLINRMYEQKSERIAQLAAKREWGRYIFMHERPYRLDALTDVREKMGDDRRKFWSLVHDVWVDSENIFQNLDLWAEVWMDDTPGRYTAMSADDRATLEGLGPVVTVYRGINEHGTVAGMSWTIDKAKALWFAERFSHGGGKIITGQVTKPCILAFLSDRGEQEIVALPEAVEVHSIEEINQ